MSVKSWLGFAKRSDPSEDFQKCPSCGKELIKKELAQCLYVCSKCGCHLRMPMCDRLAMLCDSNSFIEINTDLCSSDPLEFVDSKPYKQRISESIKKTDAFDAVCVGRATLDSIAVFIGVMNFEFMGGSMGSVVGEKLTAMFEAAADSKTPVIVVSSSGGARMQEGILSLMQMAKTAAAVKRLNNAAVPFISVLSDPTTGGVSASFASLGDVNITEPGALIGFAGPRVIEQTIGQKLPAGFQRAEFLLSHGMVDCVVHRRGLKAALAKILRYLLPNQEP